MFFLAVEPHFLQEGERTRFDFLLVLLQHVDWRHHDVLQRSLVREQVVLLKHHRHVLAQRDFLLIGLDLVHIVRANADGAAIDLRQAVEAAQQRGFAGSRGADDAHGLAFRDVERDAAQDFRFAEGFVDVFDADVGFFAHILTAYLRSMATVQRAIG